MAQASPLNVHTERTEVPLPENFRWPGVSPMDNSPKPVPAELNAGGCAEFPYARGVIGVLTEAAMDVRKLLAAVTPDSVRVAGCGDVTLRLLRSSLALTAAALACVAGAQEYPARPVRLVVPFVAGGTATINARMVAEQVAQQIGQSIVVDNRPGANGMIGIQIVANAVADGYTMLYTTTSIAINPSFYKKLPYDLFRDLQPVTIIAVGVGNVLLAHSAFPPRSVKELIAYAKEKPVTYSSGGVGNSTHLIMEMFGAAAGVKMTHVPFKGVAPAMTAVIGGEVNVIFMPPTGAMPHIRAERVRVLGFSGKTRWAALPHVPTLSESALPGWHKDSGFNVWLAPAKTPARIVAMLQGEIRKALQVRKVQDMFVDGAYETVGNTPAEATVFLREQVKFYQDIAQRIGIVPE